VIRLLLSTALMGLLAPSLRAVDSPSRDWPVFRGDAALNGIASGELPDALSLLWSVELAPSIASSPVVVGDQVLIGADDAKLHCRHLEDGREIWAFETGDMIEAAPLVIDERVFVGSSDGFFYAVALHDGAPLWKAETGAEILGSANRLEGPEGLARVVVGSYDATLYCYDAATGTPAWTYSTEDRINGSPSVLDGQVVIGGCDTNLHVVSGETGDVVKKIPMGNACHIAASSGLKDGHAYFGHHGNAFVSLSLETGELAWSYTHPSQGFFSPPAIGEEFVVFGGRDKRLHCLARATGEVRWTHPTRRRVDSAPVVCGDRVVFGSGDGLVRVVDLADGEEIWSYDLGRPVIGSPAVVRGRILVGGSDGTLYCFGASP